MSQAEPGSSASPGRARRAVPSLLEVTPDAAGRIARMSAEAGRTLRVSLSVKGCAGMSYRMEWVDEPLPGDAIVDAGGARLAVAGSAALFLAGARVRWEEGPLSSGFQISSDREKGRCGCGESFSA